MTTTFLRDRLAPTQPWRDLTQPNGVVDWAKDTMRLVKDRDAAIVGAIRQLIPVDGGQNSYLFKAGSVAFAGPNGGLTENNGQLFWDNTNTRLGIGAGASPAATLTVGAALPGSAVSPIVMTNAGALANAVGSELALASIGFLTGNTASLGIRARRAASPTDWTGTELVLELDVDNTPRAGAHLRLHANGGVGVGISPVADAKLQVNGHIHSTGTAPTVSACGSSPAGSVAGSDVAGIITTGGTGPTFCTLNFGSAWNSPPSCVFTSINPVNLATAPTTSSVSVAFSACASCAITYVCVGKG